MRFITLSVLLFLLTVGDISGQPPTVIDNDVVHIVFDHDKGGIDELTYKYGSNQNILDPYWNRGGLGRLGYLGEPGQDETGTVVTDWEVQSSYAYFVYENPLYGTKRFDISWSVSSGVEIVFTFNFDSADDRRETRGIWEPGGNNDGNDYITVLKADGTEGTFHYVYPGPWTLIWEGNAYGTIMWDADYNERIGYRTDCYIHTRFAQGASADGPYHLMDQSGTYIIDFAVKNSSEFGTWFNSYANSGQPCQPCTCAAFFDNFEDGNIDGWSVIQLENTFGNADISPQQPCEGNYSMITWKYSWPLITIVKKDDFCAFSGIYEALFFVDGGVADGDLFFQFKDQDNYYGVLCRPNGTDNPEVMLERSVNGVRTHLAVVPATFGLNECFKVTVNRYPEGGIEVYINDSLQISVNDTAIMEPGGFCVGSWQRAYVDNVSYQPLNTIPTLVIVPDTMYYFYKNTINPMMATVYIGDFTDGHIPNDIVVGSIRINGSIEPDSVDILPSYPGFTDEVIRMVFPISEFLDGYGVFWGIDDSVYTVSGEFTDSTNFSVDGIVTLIGHKPGDLDGDGNVNIADLTFLVAFLFQGGPPPQIMEAADVNGRNGVNVADLTYLINYLFSEDPRASS